MLKIVVKGSCLSRVAKAAVLAALVGLLASGNAAAQQPRDADTALVAATAAVPAVGGTSADLERAFWVCDYAATTGAAGLAAVVACVTVTEAFKKARFGGDLDAMITWWRQHKPAAHEAVETARAERGFLDWTALPR